MSHLKTRIPYLRLPTPSSPANFLKESYNKPYITKVGNFNGSKWSDWFGPTGLNFVGDVAF